MAFAEYFDDIGPVLETCPSCLRKDALGTLKQALRTEPLDGRSASLLAAAVIELETDPDLDPRAVLALFRRWQQS